MRRFIYRIADVFVPSERNGMLPYALHEAGSALYFFFALLLLLSPSCFNISQLASLAEPFKFDATSVVRLINGARTAAGLEPLSLNSVLALTAEKKNEDMFAGQYFAHISPTGKTPWTFLKEDGYAYRAAGENLASDFLTAEDAHAAFMESPTHRANILSPLYSEVGVSVKQGILNGKPTILIAEYFGKPKVASAATGPSSAKATADKPAKTATRAKPAAVSPKPAPTAPLPTPAMTPPTTATAQPLKGDVLGSETPKENLQATAPSGLFARLLNGFAYAKGQIPASFGLKVLAFLALCSLLVATAMLFTRTHDIPFGVGVRAALIFLLLGYAATFGIHPWDGAQITSVAAATV